MKRRGTWTEGDWPEGRSRPRVLVEDTDGGVLAACASVLSKEGFDVATCSGPQTMGRRECPLVANGTCALVAGADVVYTSLNWKDPKSIAVLDGLSEHYPSTPVVVETVIGQAPTVRAHAEHARIVLTPSGRRTMVAALRAEIAEDQAARTR